MIVFAERMEKCPIYGKRAVWGVQGWLDETLDAK
jgi:hypothetical protein